MSPYEALTQKEIAQYRAAVFESGLSAQDILEWRLEKHGRELRMGGRKVGEALPEGVSFPPWESTADGEGTMAKPYKPGQPYQIPITDDPDVLADYEKTVQPWERRWRRRPVRESMIEKTMMR